MSVLPKEIDYSSQLASLPDGTSTLTVVTVPSNGQSFAAQSIIQFDLVSRGFLIPSSMYLRYKCAVTNATTASFMKGTPFATPFLRSEVYCGSQVIESITNYHQLYNFIVQTKLNPAQKAGKAYQLGLLDNTTTQTFANLNARNIPIAGDTFTVSAPLFNILSNADHLIPLELIPGCRIQLTLDSVANMFTTATPTAISLTNLELVYDVVNFNGDVKQMVKQMANSNGDIVIKSQSYASAGQTIASGTTGSIELVYNMRLSSIKSVAAIFTRPAVNTFLDSVDVTSGNGDYSFLIAGSQYPPRPISTVLNKASVLSELQAFWGTQSSLDSQNLSISPVEFSYVSAGSTTAQVPGKFYVGTNVEQLSTNNFLLTGISSQNSPISLRVNTSTATGEAHTAQLIVLFDALLQINVDTNQLVVKQ